MQHYSVGLGRHLKVLSEQGGIGRISFHSPVEIYFLLATQNCKENSISHVVTSKYLHYTYLCVCVGGRLSEDSLRVCGLLEDSLHELALSSHHGRPRVGTQAVKLVASVFTG